MARYEEGEFDLLEYDVLKAHRFLGKRRQIKAVEKLVLNSVKKLIKVTHSREATSVFVQFYSSLKDMEESWMMPLQLTTGNAFYRWVRHKLPPGKVRTVN